MPVSVRSALVLPWRWTLVSPVNGIDLELASFQWLSFVLFNCPPERYGGGHSVNGLYGQHWNTGALSQSNMLAIKALHDRMTERLVGVIPDSLTRQFQAAGDCWGWTYQGAKEEQCGLSMWPNVVAAIGWKWERYAAIKKKGCKCVVMVLLWVCWEPLKLYHLLHEIGIGYK